MFAPEFVFSIASAMVADRYLSSNLEIETIAHKVSIFLQLNYSDENAQSIRTTAEEFMHSMLEAGIDNADVILLNYQYEKFVYKGNGKLRNWSPLLGDPLQSIKKRLYTPKSINRDFKAFVYRTKQSGAYNCPDGWSLSNQVSCSILKDMGNLEVTAFDILALGNQTGM
ncbi:hypothetical protein IMCC1933_24310 [Rhodobacteraceae bacterium IMCC1933]|nr:hypothetical protein [Rhodobacteraceae bacterium IMCC1923]MDP4068869.1 hypothetical protein [Rhodobacteraceae bacterium IMCC1933]MDP4069924.1 hypothetical protein [Rhodobacteraceae bacterium IMCC1909]